MLKEAKLRELACMNHDSSSKRTDLGPALFKERIDSIIVGRGTISPVSVLFSFSTQVGTILVLTSFRACHLLLYIYMGTRLKHKRGHINRQISRNDS